MATIRVTVTHPTVRSDGTPFPPAELRHVRLEMRAEAASAWSAVGTPMLPTELSRNIQNVPGGAYRVRALWVDTGDRVSDPAEAPVVVPTAAPAAGTIVPVVL